MTPTHGTIFNSYGLTSNVTGSHCAYPIEYVSPTIQFNFSQYELTQSRGRTKVPTAENDTLQSQTRPHQYRSTHHQPSHTYLLSKSPVYLEQNQSCFTSIQKGHHSRRPQFGTICPGPETNMTSQLAVQFNHSLPSPNQPYG